MAVICEIYYQKANLSMERIKFATKCLKSPLFTVFLKILCIHTYIIFSYALFVHIFLFTRIYYSHIFNIHIYTYICYVYMCVYIYISI